MSSSCTADHILNYWHVWLRGTKCRGCQDYEWISGGVLMVRLQVVVIFHVKCALMRLPRLCWYSWPVKWFMSTPQRWDLNVMRPCHSPQRRSDGTEQLTYKESAISPLRVPLNKPSVDMNNVPFKQPTIVDAYPLSRQLERPLAYVLPDHRLKTTPSARWLDRGWWVDVEYDRLISGRSFYKGGTDGVRLEESGSWWTGAAK